MPPKDARRWMTRAGALSIAGGVVVLLAMIWQVGAGEIIKGFANVGWAFPLIVALGGLRFLVRACGWTLCIDPPHELPIRRALAAVLAGDALGNATPLGPVVGEPAKVAFARDTIATAPALTALAIENLFYTLATGAMIVAGTLALLFAFDLPAPLRGYSEAAVIALALALAGLAAVLWTRPAIVSRWLPLISRPGTKLHARREKLLALERNIYSFASRRRGRVLPVSLLEVGFHALGVVETHVTLWMILGAQPPVLISFVVETASRLITVLFKFIPLQIGVAEGGLAMITELLGFGAGAGVTFSLVRKARVAVWAVVGAGLLIRRGVSPSMVLADANLSIDSRNS